MNDLSDSVRKYLDEQKRGPNRDNYMTLEIPPNYDAPTPQ